VTVGLLVAAGIFLAGCGSCGSELDTEVPLEQVANEVQFESVERLGPHVFTATISRTRTSSGKVVSQSDETIETIWQDWDSFKHRRLGDGDLRSAVIVTDSGVWTRRLGGGYTRADDAEVFRVQLRTTWRIWDEALEQFAGRIVLTPDRDAVVEGRPARRFAVSLAPDSDDAASQRKRRSGVPWPSSLEGFVVIDEGTAVRLEADVTGELTQGSSIRSVRLRLARTSIGVFQEVLSPVEQRKRRKEAKAADAATDGGAEDGAGDAAEDLDAGSEPSVQPAEEAASP